MYIPDTEKPHHHRVNPPPGTSGTQVRDPKGADLDYSLSKHSSCVALNELLGLFELGPLRSISLMCGPECGRNIDPGLVSWYLNLIILYVCNHYRGCTCWWLWSVSTTVTQKNVTLTLSPLGKKDPLLPFTGPSVPHPAQSMTNSPAPCLPHLLAVEEGKVGRRVDIFFCF